MATTKSKVKNNSYGIHWFRRDLRIAGNESLRFNWTKNDGRVLGIFVFDKKFLARSDFSINRFQFFLETLSALKDELQKAGGDLLVLDVSAPVAFEKLFSYLQKSDIDLPSLVSWSRDYEPYARARDEQMQFFLKKSNVPVHTERDHLLIEPHELSRDDGSSYQVYSPFSRKWLELFKTPVIQERIRRQTQGIKYLVDLQKGSPQKMFHLRWSEILGTNHEFKDCLDIFISNNLKNVSVPIPKAGSQSAFEKLQKFKKSIENYKDGRDFPNRTATSGLSIFLKNGSLTTSQIVAHLGLEPYHKKKSSQDTFFSELIWREFYYHILFHHPRVENEAFLVKYKKIKWQNNEKWFSAWKNGLTGFPIVDAGMRQLKSTGWMHNRVRMIVASFLTKDLLIDWQWGEQHFMEALLDGDLAANNGGWQWAASTGCDPQPYFRIFNPWLQSAKFDPDGEYIKEFVPELKGTPAKDLHEPIIGHKIYPAPIVDHSVQRNLALKMYEV